MIQNVYSDNEFPKVFQSKEKLNVNSILKLNDNLEIAKVLENDEEENTIKILMILPKEENLIRYYDIETIENENDEIEEYIYFIKEEIVREFKYRKPKICMTREDLRSLIANEISKYISRNKLKSTKQFLNSLNAWELAKNGKLYDKK